jgi:N-acetylglutamate synthase-like GNAT family acetyltransferase
MPEVTMNVQLFPVSGRDAALSAALAEADLPTEDLVDSGRSFFRVERDGNTLGFGGYEAYGTNALLRSVVVLPGHRGKGEGRAVTEAVLNSAREAGVLQAYLLTATAEGFFEHVGFDRAAREEVPAAILATKQATTICRSATLMRKAL